MSTRIAVLIYLILGSGFSLKAQDLLFSTEQQQILKYSDHEQYLTNTNDFNADNYPDILSSNGYQILLYKNNGSGAFNYPELVFIVSDSSKTIHQLTSADIDKDGDADVLMLRKGQISWLENLGNANFLPAKNLTDNSVIYNSFFLVDANVDGRLDFFVYDNFKVSLLVNHKMDSFQKVILDSNQYLGTIDVTTCDFDSDGILDLLVYSKIFLKGLIYYFKANVDGSYNEAKEITTHYDAPGILTKFVDVDGDTLVDYLVCESIIENSNFCQLVWYEQGPNATFVKQATYNKVITAYDLITCDFDQDGFIDVLYLDEARQNINWLKSDGKGVFKESGSFNMGATIKSAGLKSVDFNNDGWPDVFAQSYKKESIFSWKNNKSKTLSLNEISHAIAWMPNVYAADMNQDSSTDVIFSNIVQGQDLVFKTTICVSFNDKTEFKNKTVVHTELDAIDKMHVADINGDALPDLVMAKRNSNELFWIRNLGNRLFDTTVTLAIFNAEVKDILIQDIDKDGDQDIFIVEFNSSQVHTFINNGNGQFTRANFSLPNNITLNKLCVVDMDSDGDMDMVAIEQGGKSVLHLKNQGSDVYESKKLHTKNSGYANLEVFDLDGDGDLDILVTGSSFSYSVSWIENLGMDSFNVIQQLVNKVGIVRSVLHADYDQDGDEDIIYALNEFEEKRVFMLENIGGGRFFESKIISSADKQEMPLAAGDMNADGLHDIIIPDYRGLFWLENITSHPVLHGMHFYDENQNGVPDLSERGIAIGKTILKPNDVAHFTNNTGNYSYYLYPGSYKIQYDSLSASDWKLTSDSAIYHVVLNSKNTSEERNFGLYPKVRKNDATIVLSGDIVSCKPRSWNEIIFKNIGTTILNGTINLNLDKRLTSNATFKYVPAPDLNLGDTVLTWKFSRLFPSDNLKIRLKIELNSGAVAVINPGEVLKAKVYAIYQSSIGTDTTNDPGNLKFLCAYDPNDKITNPFTDTLANLTLKNQKLIYTVRFQNTGNDTAHEVTIIDSISNMLNLQTFKFLGSSHEENLTISLFESNILRFAFHNIMLPDSGTNYEASQGYLSFQIFPHPNLPDSSEVFNNAAIFFDQNPPIITKKVLNTLMDSLPVVSHPDKNKILAYRLYPNPSSGKINIEIPDFSSHESIEIYNTVGQMVQSYQVSKPIASYSIEHLASGLYFVSVFRNHTLINTQRLLKE